MMNSIDGHSLETMDRLSSTNTLKRHPKVDLNKNDLLRLLSYLEGELQARDISIATLKTERARHLLYQAKYGRFGLGDPFLALQRDCTEDQEGTFSESSVKILYDNQLMQLENLIETQKRAQVKMQEQIASIERKYQKALGELEDEKRKHAQDTAQGDDVTYMLEKERGRLKQELDFEKSQRRKLEKDLKKITTGVEEEKKISQKHKEVALGLIKDKKELFEKLLLFQERNIFLEKQMQNWGDSSKDKSVNQILALEKNKLALQMEAAMEKQLSDFDIERERLSGLLNKEKQKSARLQDEVELHKKGPEMEFSSSAAVNRSPYLQSSLTEGSRLSLSSDRDKSSTRLDSRKELFNSGTGDKTRSMENSADAFGGPTFSSVSESSREQIVYSSNATSRVPPVSAPTRKTPIGGRGVPPPIPPNKPQITIPQLHRKEVVLPVDSSIKTEISVDSMNARSGKKDIAGKSFSGVFNTAPSAQPVKSSDIPVVQSLNVLKRDT